MRLAGYVRVSTKDQNLELQENAISTYGRHTITIFREKESTRNTRPVKEDVLQRVRRGEFEGVIVWKLDRWGRSLRELVLDLEEFMQRDKVFISIQDNIDLSTSAGRLQAAILAAFAQFERDMISERTRAGLQAARAGGKRLGRPPGAKDKKKRKTTGYLLRYANKKRGGG